MTCEKPTHIDLFTGIPSEDSPLQHHGQDSKPSLCAKPTLFDEQDLPERGPECPSSRTCESSTELPGQDALFSPEEFPASPPHGPGSNEAREMTVGSGERLYASLERLNLATPFLKTLLESRTWGSTECYLTWKLRATKSGRYSIYQLAASIPRNSGDDCGLWRSISKQEPGITIDRLQTKDGKEARPGERLYDKETGRLAQVGLTQQVQMTAMWPTPAARDVKNPSTLEERKGHTLNLHDIAKTALPGPTTSGSPAGTVSFVGRLLTLSAWLMGYRREYLENFWLASGTQSFPRSPRK